ncbi:MAG TPA: SDR family oxidoreductase [Pseudonocardiaceae bacterium]|nr:SDR family oxidoreductase [Pseudonocardiaceae bacterium]
MAKTILVTGGTGTLGRAVVTRLVAAGAEVRVASRGAEPTEGQRPYTWHMVDYRTGAGVDDAVAGVDVIVHCVTGMRTEADVTRRLATAALAAGGPHLVYISIVGVDKVPFGYYRGKLAAEQVVRASGLPWTIQRATQFHGFVLAGIRALARLPIMPVPTGIRVQTIDVGEVADRLVEQALGEPAGAAPDLGGPAVQDFADLTRAYFQATGRSRPMLPIRLPGKVVRTVRAGGLTTPEHAEGRISFAEFLTNTPLTGARK